MVDETQRNSLFASKKGAAVHEAAHAVVAVSHGDCIGRIKLTETEDGWMGQFRRRPQKERPMHEEAERLLAGDMAQHKYFEVAYRLPSPTLDGQTDGSRVWALASEARPYDAEGWLSTCAGQTQGTLNRGQHWNAICKLANLIAKHGVVSGQQIIDLLANFKIQRRDRSAEAVPLDDVVDG